MLRKGAIIFISLFLLFLVGFSIKVGFTAKAAYEDRIERLCAPQQESRWAFLAPPKEKTDFRKPIHEECGKAAEGALQRDFDNWTRGVSDRLTVKGMA